MNRKPTESEKKASKELIVSIATSLGMTLMNPDKIRSRHDYNMYVFTYESLFAEIPMEVIIETSYYQTVYPVEKHEVGSFVGKFCDERGITLPIPFEAATVVMSVQSLNRTFNNPSAQLDCNIPEMLKEIIHSRFYESDYRNVTQKLLYEDIDYDYAIAHGIAIVAKLDIFEYRKK